jgi:hypothetical protein
MGGLMILSGLLVDLAVGEPDQSQWIVPGDAELRRSASMTTI